MSVKCTMLILCKTGLKMPSTASASALIGQLHWVKVILVGAESVHQNCVIGRCANLHIHILLQLQISTWNTLNP